MLYFNGLSGIHKNKTAEENQIKVACVGDSITYGLGVENWSKNNYPKVLNNLLGKDYSVSNFGVSGSCVQDTGDKPYLLTEMYQESLAYEADVLIFMLGTNDTKTQNWKGTEVFKEKYLEVLDSYLQGEKVPKVYLGTSAMAYYTDGKTEGVAEFDIQPELVKEVVEVVREIAKERGYELIEIHELTREHPEWFEADGIHPNADGAAEIAQLAAETINGN